MVLVPCSESTDDDDEDGGDSGEQQWQLMFILAIN